MPEDEKLELGPFCREKPVTYVKPVISVFGVIGLPGQDGVQFEHEEDIFFVFERYNCDVVLVTRVLLVFFVEKLFE